MDLFCYLSSSERLGPDHGVERLDFCGGSSQQRGARVSDGFTAPGAVLGCLAIDLHSGTGSSTLTHLHMNLQ